MIPQQHLPGGNLTAARYKFGVSSFTVGYFGGGTNPKSTVDKLTYSSDTARVH